MSEFTDSLNNLLNVLNDMIDKADYSDVYSICHKRIKAMDNMIVSLLKMWHYEQYLITRDEFNELNQKECDIYNKYLKYLNIGKRE